MNKPYQELLLAWFDELPDVPEGHERQWRIGRKGWFYVDIPPENNQCDQCGHVGPLEDGACSECGFSGYRIVDSENSHE